VQGNERWKQLCEQASREQDPKRLVELITEINKLLDAKRHRLEDKTSADQSD
jgi:hypothetical protein